ncbi:pseudouridine synthase [Dyadobacter chenhuakuii]|jgi:23S rRNA pseudouridine2605 synthase|uniref:Pseudouridine synthase n=1 Tax=Dyadobacter chenhuakuii TaxID=2909339 RepID=A0ABY4XH55_9BACT|nr:pseudouridine synthase [Dyadobacter chenhuakuii]MCF2495712.1 pseudouridine synthase [Dyadobacter chenhuakuii]USJ29744.1 pseudouridine synthase [Dyadobacter chenhuakuii]
MRKRTSTPSKAPKASQPSTGGQKSFRKSSDGAGHPFKKARPEAESRFSKPSIKKSSLRTASSNGDNAGQKARPSFDHEKGSSDRSGFDKPGFGKPGFDKPRFDKPRFDKPSFKSGFDKPRFDKPGNDRPSFPKKEGGFRSPADKKDFGQRERSSGDREFKPRFERPAREGDRPRFERRGDDRPAQSGESRPFRSREESGQRERPSGDREFKPRFERREGDRPTGDREFKPRAERPAREGERRDSRPSAERSFGRPSRDGKPEFKKKDETAHVERDFEKSARSENAEQAEDRSGLDRRVGRFESAPRYNLSSYEKKNAPKRKEKEESALIRLNRYISNAGICSRREADDLIASGQISVNGKTITEMGYKVLPTDVVKYGKKALNPEKMVYILINKPKDYITTTDDPEERKTVLDLIQGACAERVYPVGRLDRNTTGLLLLTNDGELAVKLTHPSGGIKKIYQAELDKPITTEDFEKLQHGLELEDGFIRPDEVGIVTPDAMVVGLEIHSGRNRIVRRMFEHLGYEVQKLDRTVFAGLNKKDLPRGKWRFLSEKEVVKLKFML